MIFVVQIRSYPALTVNIEVYVKVWNRPICICINGIDVIKKKTYNYLVKTSSISRNLTGFCFFSWEAPVWSLYHKDKGASRQEKEHRLYT